MDRIGEALDFFRESFFIMSLSLLVAFLAGIILGSDAMVGYIEEFPGLLLIVPAFLATRGNVYGVLGARVSTALHQGLFEPGLKIDWRLKNAVLASIINGVLVSGLMGLLGWSFFKIIGRNVTSFFPYMSILILAGLLTGITLSFLIVSLLFLGYYYGIDPDIVNGPIVTSLGDLIGTLILFVSVIVVRWVIIV